MPLNRLKEKTTTDILWIYILKLLKSRKMYAYEIKAELQKKFGIEPALITPYVVLYRLEKAGYVSSKWNENKKYYIITPEGEKLLQKGIRHIEGMLEKLAA